MGKIKLGNDQILDIIADGITEAGDGLTIQLVPGNTTIDTYDNLFSDPANTGKIWVLDYNGDLFKSHSGFTKILGVEKQYDVAIDYTTDEDGNKVPVTGTAVQVRLSRPDQTEQRIVVLEETVDTLIMETLGM